MKRSLSITALAAGTLMLTASAASAQTPYYPQGSTQQPTYPPSTYDAQYGQSQYGQSQYGQGQYGQTTNQPADALTAILGTLFGDQFGASSSLDSQWSRGRRPLNTQRAQFRAQVEAEVRRGALSSSRAARINERYDALVQLEARYASDGRITTQERADLAERYRRLTDQLDDASGGGGGGGGYGNPIADGRTAFEARIDSAVRDRSISRDEGYRLRSEYQSLIQLETSYGRNGLDANERADLQYRLSALEQRLGGDYGGGGGYGNQGRISAIESGIAGLERSGVSRSETERLRTELGDLTRLDAAYSANGLNSDESAYLTRRLGELDQRVRNTRR